MTQEQKEKLEQAAKDYIKPFAHQLHLGADEGLIMDLVGFAQTILDNPGEWGLISLNESNILFADNMDLVKSETAKYREALERIIDKYYSQVSEIGEPKWIAKELVELAKEALKNDES